MKPEERAEKLIYSSSEGCCLKDNHCFVDWNKHKAAIASEIKASVEEAEHRGFNQMREMSENIMSAYRTQEAYRLNKAKAEAFEEAAKIAENHPWRECTLVCWCKKTAEAIRAKAKELK